MNPGTPSPETVASELAASIARFESTLWNSLIVIALVGVLAMFFVQILKPVLRFWVLFGGLRAWMSKAATQDAVEQIMFDRPGWLLRLPNSKGAGTSKPQKRTQEDERAAVTEALGYFSTRSALLPRDLFIKEVQNRVQQILEHPSDNIGVFVRVTNGAAPFDQALACLVDQTMREDPAGIARLDAVAPPQTETPPADRQDDATGGGYAAVIASAQDRIAAAAERNLDALQIRVTAQWPSAVRIFTSVCSTVIAVVGGVQMAALPLASLWWLMVLFGLAGGYAASLAYDGLSIVGRLKPR